MSFRLVPKSSAEGPCNATGILYNCEVEILQQMLKFKTSCAVLAYLSSNLLKEVGLFLFRYFQVGLRVCDIVVKKFTFAISSDEFLYFSLFFRCWAVRQIKLAIPSAFEHTLIYRIVSYRIVSFHMWSLLCTVSLASIQSSVNSNRELVKLFLCVRCIELISVCA